MSGLISCFVYPSAFHSFYEQTPPPGWEPRYGGILANVSTDYPALLAHLTDPANAWKVKTESEWQAMSAATPWNGIGGVPYFVVDADEDTIRLPDTRGMYQEDAGFDGLEVGGVHGDAIRNITGGTTTHITTTAGNHHPNGTQCASGAISMVISGGSTATNGKNARYTTYDFNASRVVPVAKKNQPRAFGILPCVYVGGM